MRSASPTPPTEAPSASDGGVGAASRNAAIPSTYPRGTRHRASRFAASPTRSKYRARATLHGGAHFGDRHVRKTPCRLVTAALVVAPARLVSRHGDVRLRVRTVARRIRRSEQRD